MRHVLAIVGVFCLAWSTVWPAAAGERYAFLVAVGDYPATQLRSLKYSRNDILEFHKLLLESGYESAKVVLLVDDVEALKAKYAGSRSQLGRYLPEADKEFAQAASCQIRSKNRSTRDIL